MSRVPFPIRGEYALRRFDHQRSILFNHHWNSARTAGLRREQLEQLEDFEASGKFDELERAVIRYAQAVTLRNEVSDATWSDLALAPFADLSRLRFRSQRTVSHPAAMNA